LPLVYGELRRLAAEMMAQERPGQTLQATAFVHEAYLRLVDVKKSQQWNGRGHFFIAAAEAMRRILVEQSRRKRSLRRGGEFQRQDMEHVEIAAHEPSIDVMAVNEALVRFEQADKLNADLVTLRYFAGMTVAEAAEALGIAPASADRYWAYACAWASCRESATSCRKETTSRFTFRTNSSNCVVS